MKAKKTEPVKRNEIRITNIPEKTFQNLKIEAKKNCRSISKEVLYLIIDHF